MAQFNFRNRPNYVDCTKSPHLALPNYKCPRCTVAYPATIRLLSQPNFPNPKFQTLNETHIGFGELYGFWKIGGPVDVQTLILGYPYVILRLQRFELNNVHH